MKFDSDSEEFKLDRQIQLKFLKNQISLKFTKFKILAPFRSRNSSVIVAFWGIPEDKSFKISARKKYEVLLLLF